MSVRILVLMELNSVWTVHLISLRAIGSGTFPQALLSITRNFFWKEIAIVSWLVNYVETLFSLVYTKVSIKLRILIRGSFLLCVSYGYLLNSKKPQKRRRRRKRMDLGPGTSVLASSALRSWMCFTPSTLPFFWKKKTIFQVSLGGIVELYYLFKFFFNYIKKFFPNYARKIAVFQ